MSTERQKLESRILNILSYTNHPVKEAFEKNLNIFNLRELSQINEYLETGSLNPIYQFLEDKQKEYQEIMDQLKIIKKLSNLRKIKLKEEFEARDDQKELDLINFDY